MTKRTKKDSTGARAAADRLSPDPNDIPKPKRKSGKKPKVYDPEDPPPPDLPYYAVPKEMTEEETKRLMAASALLKKNEDNLIALVRAASERWRPSQSLYETDETSAPVFGDDEYAETLWRMETVAEIMEIRLLGQFFGLPEAILDDVCRDKLRLKFLPKPQQGGVPFSIRRGKRGAEME